MGEPFSGAVYNLVGNFDESMRASGLSTLVEPEPSPQPENPRPNPETPNPNPSPSRIQP